MGNLQFTRLTTLTFEEVEKLWNRGFEEYMVDISMSIQQIVNRFGMEGISPELSVVAWVDNEPVGFVFNGIRQSGGETVAWNGGTGVIPEYRRKGIAKELIAASLDVYRENGVELATLEAIGSNFRAIPLYEKMGYQTIHKIGFLRFNGEYSDETFGASGRANYEMVRGIARDVSELSFYNVHAPWQCQWQSALGGESVILYNYQNQAVGYSLFRRVFNDHNELRAIVLMQCEVRGGQSDAEDILRTMLKEVYGPATLVCQRSTSNLNLDDARLMSVLRQAGFEVTVDQVYMERRMEGM